MTLGYSCVYIFQIMYPEKTNWKIILLQTNPVISIRNMHPFSTERKLIERNYQERLYMLWFIELLQTCLAAWELHLLEWTKCLLFQNYRNCFSICEWHKQLQRTSELFWKLLQNIMRCYFLHFTYEVMLEAWSFHSAFKRLDKKKKERISRKKAHIKKDRIRDSQFEQKPVAIDVDFSAEEEVKKPGPKVDEKTEKIKIQWERKTWMKKKSTVR